MSTADMLIEQGREQGLERGREEGLEQGKIETARNMINGGLDLFTIARFTGLSEEKLIKIRDNSL